MEGTRYIKCPDCGKRTQEGGVHTCSPQVVKQPKEIYELIEKEFMNWGSKQHTSTEHFIKTNIVSAALYYAVKSIAIRHALSKVEEDRGRILKMIEEIKILPEENLTQEAWNKSLETLKHKIGYELQGKKWFSIDDVKKRRS